MPQLHHSPKLASVFLFAMITVGCGTSPHPKNSVVPPASAASIPKGLRLTANGWEDASSWGVVRDDPEMVEHWLQVQRQREPKWARSLLSRIRATSPLTIALIQIAAITCIFRVSRFGSDDRRRSQHCPSGSGNPSDQ